MQLHKASSVWQRFCYCHLTAISADYDPAGWSVRVTYTYANVKLPIYTLLKVSEIFTRW